MSDPLRVLVIEDSESDAAMMIRVLEKASDQVRWQRVESAAEMQQALVSETWDVVISDYRMPQFDAPAALATLQQAGLDVPFIVVSGTIGEETAVAMMKAGAQDYLRKENLARLAPAIEREIAEARDRELRRRAEAALRESETRFQTLVEMAPEAIFIQADKRFVYVNGAAQRLFGASRATQLLGRQILDVFHPDAHAQVRERIRLLNEEHMPVPLIEEVGIKLDGSRIQLEVSAVPFNYQGENGALVFARDITERKRADAALAEQMEELRRWHDATLGRETRIIELKREVNQLLVEAGRRPRYASLDDTPA